MDLGLAGRTYLVTGGTSGLGRAVAGVLADEGANVVVASRDADRVAAAADELGANALGVVADLTDQGAPQALLDAIHARFGTLDGLLVSHGGPPASPAADLDDDKLAAAVAGSIVGPVRLVREVAADLGEGGSIVILTSTSSVEPIPGLASSNVARPAVWGYAKTLAAEVGPRGVRVNVLLPGRFATGRVAQLDRASAAREGITPEQARTRSEAAIPLRRLGDPDELGRVAAFLLSPAASYVTGAAWAVDGGNIRGL